MEVLKGMTKALSPAAKYRKRAYSIGKTMKTRRKSERGPLRKKQRALNDMADNEDWLEGKSTAGLASKPL